MVAVSQANQLFTVAADMVVSSLSLLGCDSIAQDVGSTAFRRNRQLELSLIAPLSG